MSPHPRPAVLAALVLACGLTAGACGGGSSHTLPRAQAPVLTRPAPTAGTRFAPPSADLNEIDNATAQVDQNLGSADQGLNGTEPDPSQ